jgi:dihydroorotase
MNHFDLIIRGEVVDPSQNLRGPRDIGIRDGVIVAVEESLEGAPRDRFLDADGSYVSPGFVDIHAHVYAGVTSWGVKPDPPCIRSGVTTVVDAGSPGWTMLQGFRWYVHEPSIVRALCFLHISGVGLVNAWVDECKDLVHLHPETVGHHVAENRDFVVGVKVRQGKQQVWTNGIEPLRLAVQAAEIASDVHHGDTETRRTQGDGREKNGERPVPVMVHIAAGVALKDVLDLLRPGDIVTHCFQGRGEEGENLTDSRGRVLPEVLDARQKGVVMDVAHGGGSFRWEVAEAALQHGFLPDVLSTDLHAYNMHGPLFDMATTLTKFLYLGLPLEKVIECATVAPARAIGRPDLGTLALGAPADLAVFSLREEPVTLWDTHVAQRHWDRRLHVEATVRAGVVYHPDEFQNESEDEITRRCRVRGPEALKHSWRAMLERGQQERPVR